MVVRPPHRRTPIIYFATPYIRATTLAFAPFLVITALVTNVGINWQGTWDNSIAGRFLFAGYSLATLDSLQVLGLRISSTFASGYFGDSGYGYVLVKVGLVGLAAVWALFVYVPVLDGDARRFKTFIAFCTVFLLIISASLFSIKTAALLRFLFGTLNNPNRAASIDPSATLGDARSESA